MVTNKRYGKGIPLTEEHKRKIGEANKIKMKGKHNSPATQFKKGYVPPHKGKALPQIREENHYKWNGGVQTYRKMLERRGFKIDKCIKCGCEEKKKLVVHHIDKNRSNNDMKNLQILCHKCHNDLHDAGVKTRFKKGHKGFGGGRKKNGGNK